MTMFPATGVTNSNVTVTTFFNVNRIPWSPHFTTPVSEIVCRGLSKTSAAKTRWLRDETRVPRLLTRVPQSTDYHTAMLQSRHLWRDYLIVICVSYQRAYFYLFDTFVSILATSFRTEWYM